MDAATITAIGGAFALVIAAIGTVWVNLTTAKAALAAAQRAETAATAAQVQSHATAVAVDGQSEKLLAAVSGRGLAEGVNAGVVQQQAHEATKAAVDAATGADRRVAGSPAKA